VSDPTYPTGFTAALAEWMRGQDIRVAQVVRVEAHGSDWEGSTEGGFYTTFGIHVEYVTQEGRRCTWSLHEGEDMAALWTHMMHSWPT
jgi:hypothetical protein